MPQSAAILVRRSLPSAVYLVLLAAAGAAAVVRLAGEGGEARPAAFLILLILACAAVPLKVKLPGVDRSVSLSFAFSFAAISELPGGMALFIFSMALFCETLFERGRKPRWGEGVLAIACAAVCVLCASTLYRFLTQEMRWQRLLSLLAAGGAYFLVNSAASAVQIGLHSRVAPWKVWNEKFFWTAPLYLLAAVGVDMTRMVLDADRIPEQMLAVALIFFGYLYVKHYFARLHDQHDHFSRLDETRQRAIESLAVAIEAKDGVTSGHLERVRRHAVLLARKLKFSEEEIKTLELGAVLHDVGKVGVPDSILGKPGRLTEEEFSELAVHAALGAQIVSAVRFPYPVEEVVLSHHEHWDGSGYPRRLIGPQIPRAARVLTVVDCFDALMTDRPYRAALSLGQTMELMREQRGRIFDPQILDAFLAELPTFVESLERELAAERAGARLGRTPLARVRQTWLSRSESIRPEVRHEVIEKLSRSPEQLVAVYEILQVLGSGPDVARHLRQVLALLDRVIPHDRSGIFIREKEAFWLLLGQGIPDHFMSAAASEAISTPLSRAVMAGQPVIERGPIIDPRTGQAPHYFEDVRWTLTAPLMAEGRLVGAVALFSSREPFTEQQTWLLGLVAGKLAAAVHTARELEQLRVDAETDSLTGLPNARGTLERLEAEVDRARREGAPVAVLFMDLNGFKAINDVHGHGAGDRVLLETARVLKTFLRSYDFVGRIGGDEFLAILPRIQAQSLTMKVESLKQAVAGNVIKLAEGVHAAVGLSVGVACYPQDGGAAQDLIFQSDRRMYLNKARGGRKRPAGRREAAGLEEETLGVGAGIPAKNE